MVLEKVGGLIKHVVEGMNVEDEMFTYDDNEQQENKINRENVKRMFCPDYIILHLTMKNVYGLSLLETAILGFIRNYINNTKTKGRFYFTNEHLAEMLDCSVTAVSNAVSILKRKKIIKASYKVRANGGSIRFIENSK